jgi:hypothetical protein
MSGNLDETFAACASNRHTGWWIGAAQAIERDSGCHRRDQGTVPRDLRGEEIRVLSGGETDHAKTIRVRVDDSERAPANRPGGAENGDTLHSAHRRLGAMAEATPSILVCNPLCPSRSGKTRYALECRLFSEVPFLVTEHGRRSSSSHAYFNTT